MNKQYRSPRLPPFFLASIREGRVALIVGHPRGTHSRYVIGCCLIPLGICGLKNNSRQITYGIGCVWGMPCLSPLSSLGRNLIRYSSSNQLNDNTGSWLVSSIPSICLALVSQISGFIARKKLSLRNC